MDPEATRGPTIGRRAVIAGAVGGLGLTLSGPTLTGLTSTGLTPSSWWRALARAADEPGGAPSPSATRAAFTDLGPADALGVRVPAGFEVSLVGRSGESVAGTGYRWHDAPDGGGCIPTPGGGHLYVSNSEVDAGGGGAGGVWVDADGEIVAAHRLLSGTTRNCAGGVTPWATWLSCEESGPTGLVWECDPTTRTAAVRPAMGAFNHEAVAVDPIRRCCYLTEDDPRGRLYRFVPDRWPDLSRGVLQAAAVSSDVVRWVDVSAAVPDRSATTAAFDGGEGVALDGDGLVFTTKGDHRVWEIDLRTDRLSVLYDARVETDQPLSHVDNVVVHPTTGALYVAEDGGDMELCQVRRGPDGPEARAVVRFAGHDGSEVTGPAFSPDGRHLYVSSQRGTDGRGVTVRVSGPWDRWSWPIDTPATASRQAVRGRAVGLEP